MPVRVYRPVIGVGSNAVCAVVCALALGVSAPAGVAATAVPVPTVTGPIVATVPLGDPSHDYPYSATVDDLKKYGYVEEEFFFAGTANRYTTPPGATGAVAGHRPRVHHRQAARRWPGSRLWVRAARHRQLCDEWAASDLGQPAVRGASGRGPAPAG